MTEIIRFWGKAAGALEGEQAWHPLAYHCLDVAAVADAILGLHPRRLAVLALLLHTTPSNARRLLAALVALHDIGKFAEGFQCKSEAAWPADILGPYDPIGGVAATTSSVSICGS